ncbi:hypothetical protein MTP99_008482 [Tenebrio molitor]|nr:hypothetical protein MTP99_008482 [Tenebrio molitor]
MSGKIRGPTLTDFVDELTLGSFFFNRAEKYKDQICQIDGILDRSETYGGVKLRSVRVAMQLQKRGVKSKDVVVFCSSNTLDNAIPIIGATYLGARVANLEPSLSVRHVRHLL